MLAGKKKAVHSPQSLVILLLQPVSESAMISRRHFLSTSLGALSVSTLPAIEPITRPGKSRMQLGVAAYSFREYFQWMRDKEQKPKGDRKPWSILDFVDWCGDNNVPGAEVTSAAPAASTAATSSATSSADRPSTAT